MENLLFNSNTIEFLFCGKWGIAIDLLGGIWGILFCPKELKVSVLYIDYLDYCSVISESHESSEDSFNSFIRFSSDTQDILAKLGINTDFRAS